MINTEERRNFDSEKERNEIFKEINNIRKDVKKFKEKVKLCEKNKESLIQIQDMSENLGNKISVFKEKQMRKFDIIADEEHELYSFIDNFMVII